MTDMTTQLTLRQAEHDELARLMAQWEANPANKVERIPVGAMVSAGWNPRQVLNPSAATKALRDQELEAARNARRAQVMATPIARDLTEAPAPAPKAPKKRGRPPGKRTGRAPWLSAQAREILDLLPTHPTVPLLADRLRKDRAVVWAILDRMRRKGLVASDGLARVLTTWTVVTDAPAG